jgi:CMP-N,N'-diacetyllegionaminic acid synthase
MYRGHVVLALIPARGGSKGIARKNLMPIAGKPLIAWTIEVALSNPYIDLVVVSTEDEEIAETAVRYGAEVPFRRPKRLATDSAKGMDVVLHAMDRLEKKKPPLRY